MAKACGFIPYSGEEALKFLSERGNEIAVLLLDVVMESDNAGLGNEKMREGLSLKNHASF